MTRVGDIAAGLRIQINNGELGVGVLLPSEPDLAAGHGVSRQTARAAYQVLEREGLVVVRPKQGRVVAEREWTPRVVCLCGSTRFPWEFAEVNRTETLRGNIVLAPGVLHHAEDGELDPEVKRGLDELHRAKIRLADEVVVVAPEGYVGESTRAEVEYAEELGKPVRIISPDRVS